MGGEVEVVEELTALSSRQQKCAEWDHFSVLDFGRRFGIPLRLAGSCVLLFGYGSQWMCPATPTVYPSPSTQVLISFSSDARGESQA